MPFREAIKALFFPSTSRQDEIKTLQQDLQQNIAEQENAIKEVEETTEKIQDSTVRILDMCDDVLRTLRRARQQGK